MTDDEVKFCYKCGASLPEGADFCPECGTSMKMDGTAVHNENTSRPVHGPKKDLGPVPILIMVYGILAIICALIVLISGVFLDSFLKTLNEMVKEGVITEADYQNFLKTLGLVSEAAINAMKLQMIIEGILMAISGIAAIVSSANCGKMQNFKIAFGACVLASALPLLSIIFLDITGVIAAVVGFVMCYLIYQKKDMFIS